MMLNFKYIFTRYLLYYHENSKVLIVAGSLASTTQLDLVILEELIMTLTNGWLMITGEVWPHFQKLIGSRNWNTDRTIHWSYNVWKSTSLLYYLRRYRVKKIGKMLCWCYIISLTILKAFSCLYFTRSKIKTLCC